MGRVIDITAIIAANKALIETRRKLKRLETAITSGGDRVLEGENVTAIIRNGTITILPKIKEQSAKEDIIA